MTAPAPSMHCPGSAQDTDADWNATEIGLHVVGSFKHAIRCVRLSVKNWRDPRLHVACKRPSPKSLQNRALKP